MAVNSRGQSGRINRKNSYDRSTVSSSHYSQNSREDKAPEAAEKPLNIKPEKSAGGLPENQLAKLAEQIFGSTLDTDKLLIAALILLLLKEGADPKLILALGYIFI